MTAAKKKRASTKQARDPRRDRAFALFATGKKMVEIHVALGVNRSTLSAWKKADRWDAQVADEQRRYREELAKRSAKERAKRDAEAVAQLLNARESLLRALNDKSNLVHPARLASSIAAIQDVLTKIEPPKEQDHGHEVVDVDFVPAEMDEADGEDVDG